MSEQDPNLDQDEQSNEDPIKNLKSEFSRKFENTEKSVSSVNEKLDSIMQVISSQQSASQSSADNSANDDDDDVDKYLDPDAYIERKLGRLKQEVIKDVTTVQQQQQAAQQTYSSLAQEYPDLVNTKSELFQKASQIHQSLRKDLQNTPEGYELAVAKAVKESGYKASRNQESNQDVEDFIMGDSGGQDSSNRRKKKDGDLDPKTLAFAELMGLDIKDKKVIERLKERAKRDYKKFR